MLIPRSPRYTIPEYPRKGPERGFEVPNRDGKVTGAISVLIVSDSYVPRYDAPTTYQVDVAIDGKVLKGTHTGMFGIREPKELAVTGKKVL